ncbi:MAG: ABC transporter ATP-binding protein [Oligoflexales bacterium]
MNNYFPPTPQLAPKPLTRLFDYLKSYNQILYSSIFYSFVNKGLDLAPPVLVGWAIDTVTHQPPKFMQFLAGDSWVIAGLVLGLLGFVIFGVESFFQWLYTIGFAKLSQEMQHKLRLDAYEKMQTREMRFFENHSMGETMSMLSDDIHQLERFFNSAFNDIVQLVALFFIAGFILFTASWQLSLIAILPIPIVVWGALGFSKLLAPRYKALRESVGLVNTRLENNLSGIQVIKAFTAETYELNRLRKASEIYKDKSMYAIQLSAIFTPLIRMGVALGFGATLCAGTVWTFSGKISPGVFTLFTMMCQRILWPLTRLGNLLDETERARACAARIFGLLDSKPEIVDSPGATKLQNARGLAEFRNVVFTYDNGVPIFDRLSFTIQPGETIGIAGITGAGKSTIIKLLLRFYEPKSGEILLDGKPIASYTLESLRRQMSLVSQDVYIFQGTIADNILYSTPHAGNEQLLQASKKAQLHDFIMSLPDGYDSIVGEKGIKLSGGQRQRLSIARALLKNAPIFILDEATSSVDTQTERAIQENLREYTKDKTSLIIAHRLSTIRHCDRILVIDKGKVVEAGSHDALLKSGGIYADLWTIQQGDVRATDRGRVPVYEASLTPQ